MRLHTLRRALWLAALLPALVHAQNLDNKGVEFITTFNPNPIDGPPVVEVHLTSDVATNVTVEYPVNAPTFSSTVAVVPGSITVVGLPSAASTGWTSGAVGNNAVRLSASEEFVAYTINRENFTSDAALALPIETFNTEYIVASYTASFQGQFSVVAAFDNTDVTITPSVDLDGGFSAGTPFTVTLNRGEGFYGEANLSGAAGDLTGTIVEATNPVGMTNGNFCTNVPPGTFACDHIYEVAQPTVSWGQEVFVSPLPNRPNGSVYRILSAADGTTVSQDGAPIGTINRGDFLDTGVLPGGHVFSADGPIFVVQYMTGQSFPGATSGDPAMGNLAPSEQYLGAYTFSTIAGAFSSHFLSVIAEDADVAGGTILLDGAAIPAGSFTSITGTGFSYAVVPLTDGTHTTSSNGVHGITVEGYNNFNSYLYPGGALFQFINPGQDLTPPVCSGTQTGTMFAGSATDALADDPENTGVFFVALAPGSTNLTLNVTPFTPGDEVVSYTVTLTDATMSGNGSVVVTDGAGNTCQSQVNIQVTPGPLACTANAPLSFSAFDIDGVGDARGEFAELTNGSTSDDVDLDGCQFIVLDPLSEDVTYATAASGIVAPGGTHDWANNGGDQPLPMNSFVDTPGGAFALIDGTASVGDDVLDVLANADVVAAVVYLADESTFGSVGGGGGATVNAAALAEAFAQLGRAVAVGDGPDGALALAVAPNPVAGPARVSFALAEPADVRLAVYDALGREVARLADGPFGAGSHTARLDAAALPAGLYVVRLAAGAGVQAVPLTVTR